MNPSDFRSDTVTPPTPAMRQAMAEAVVGDDVLGYDPTVQRLEALAAEIMGKEAGLFCPSGTMGNTIAVKAWTRELQEVIVEAKSHIYNLESTQMTFISRITPRPLPSAAGGHGSRTKSSGRSGRRTSIRPRPASSASRTRTTTGAGPSCRSRT